MSIRHTEKGQLYIEKGQDKSLDNQRIFIPLGKKVFDLTFSQKVF